MKLLKFPHGFLKDVLSLRTSDGYREHTLHCSLQHVQLLGLLRPVSVNQVPALLDLQMVSSQCLHKHAFLVGQVVF